MFSELLEDWDHMAARVTVGALDHIRNMFGLLLNHQLKLRALGYYTQTVIGQSKLFPTKARFTLRGIIHSVPLSLRQGTQ